MKILNLKKSHTENKQSTFVGSELSINDIKQVAGGATRPPSTAREAWIARHRAKKKR